MAASGFALFETAIGACGIAWSDRGVVSIQLPERNEAATRARLANRCPGAMEVPPPPDVQRAVDAIVALLSGESADLSFVALDMDGVPEFHRRVYEVARMIRPGATLSCVWEIRDRRGASGRRSAAIPLSSWCLVIASWLRAARPAGFPRTAERQQSSHFWRSKARSSSKGSRRAEG